MPETSSLPSAAAAALPVTPTAPVTTGETVAVGDQTPPDTSQTFASAQEMVSAKPEDLAKRYGLTDEPLAAEPTDPAPTTEPAAAEPVEPQAAAPETPAALSDAPPLESKFSLYDDQGELEIPTNVKLSFQSDGKEYKDLRLDRVVRMAQSAPALQRQLSTVQQQHVTALSEREARIAAAEQSLQEQNALAEALLADPALYQEAAARFQAMNSPEQRLARIQQQHAREREQLQQRVSGMEFQQTVAASKQFVETRIAPSVEALTTQYPDIDPSDVQAKFHELTAGLLAPSPAGGVWVPPQRLPDLETSVLPQLTQWAQARSQKIAQRTAVSTATAQQETAKAKEQTRKAQLDAQTATRRAARPLTPIGNAPSPDVPKPKPIKTTGDAVEASLERIRQQIAGAA